MRDQVKEAKHRFDNRFPSNPTQTMYTRFFRTPKAEIKTMFTESVNKFNETKKYIDRDRLSTAYSKYLER
jgi:hypothetical protein